MAIRQRFLHLLGIHEKAGHRLLLGLLLGSLVGALCGRLYLLRWGQPDLISLLDTKALGISGSLLSVGLFPILLLTALLLRRAWLFPALFFWKGLAVTELLTLCLGTPVYAALLGRSLLSLPALLLITGIWYDRMEDSDPPLLLIMFPLLFSLLGILIQGLVFGS